MKNEHYEKVHKVNALSNDMTAIYHQAARIFAMSDSALIVLYTVYEKGDHCLLQDVCVESGISKQTVNSALRKLEAEGILYLEQDRGKNKRICLTEAGREHVERTAGRLYEAECRAFSDWTDREFETYLALMEKYNCALRREIETMRKEKG